MKKYNVLVYGSGGREHALAWKISQSPLLNKLFLVLPNDGFKDLGEEIVFQDNICGQECNPYEDLAKKCVENKINLAVIGPEAPLAEGIVDTLNSYGIKCIGVNKKWAKLESSKKFAKEFMVKHKIPTAKYFTVDANCRSGILARQPESRAGLLSRQHQVGKICKDGNHSHPQNIDEIFSQFSTPPVLKADGLAAGKGVYLSESFDDAKSTLDEFLNGKYGNASTSVVVEERLEGEELSVIALFDGKTLLPLETARDYKRLYDGQKGPNTGGMGAYCPVSLSETEQSDLSKYLKILEKALLEENADFSGVIYSGLMLTKDGIKVLEFNMRFGDPETQPLMSHLNSDILEVFIKTAEQKLSEVKLNWKAGTTIAVVLASDGYPENPKKNCKIKNLEEACKKYETEVFYAGVKQSEIENISLCSNGGRVLSICKNGSDINNVRDRIYKTIDDIDFKDKIYRTDIGK